jgi:hypothetical protein
VSTQDLSLVLRASYGPLDLSSVGMSLLSVEVRQDAVVKEGLGRVATNVQVTADFEVRKQTAADLYTAMGTIFPLLQIDGYDFVVYGLGAQIQFGMLAAESADFGPHISYTLKDSPESALCKLIQVKLTSQATWPSGNSNAVSDNFKLTVDTGPDGLRVITRSGELHGFNSPAYFLSIVVPAMAASYPLPKWVTKLHYQTSQDTPRPGTTLVQQNTLDYSVVVRENFSPLPATAHGAAVAGVAVDGVIRTRAERSEQFRKTTTIDFDFLIVGSVSAFMSVIRPSKPGVAIHRESLTVTGVREQRASGNFVLIESADHSPLLEWTQTVRLVPGTKAFEVKEYVGAPPVLVAKSQTAPRLTQTGRAVALYQFKKAPTPIFHTHLELPEIAYNDLNNQEKETTWTYVMYPSQNGNPGSLGDTGGSDDLDDSYVVPDDFDVTLLGRGHVPDAAAQYLGPAPATA